MEHWLIQYFWIFYVIEFLDRLKFCTVPRTLLNFLGHFEFFRPLWILDHLKFLQFLVIFAVLALVAGPRLHTCINCDCTCNLTTLPLYAVYFGKVKEPLPCQTPKLTIMYLHALIGFQICFQNESVVGVLSKFWAFMLKFPTWHFSGHSARNLRK